MHAAMAAWPFARQEPVDGRAALAHAHGPRALRHLRRNHTASLDPRIRSAHLMVPIERELLAHFHPGDAVLRAHAIGGPQWLRTPPPKVQQIAVRIPAVKSNPSD